RIRAVRNSERLGAKMYQVANDDGGRPVPLVRLITFHFCGAWAGSVADSEPALAAVAAGDRIAPVAPEGAAADAYSRGRLAALVFVAFHEVQHLGGGGTVEAPRFDLIHRQVLFDERLENRVEHLVGGERIGVLLPGAQLRGGRTLDHPLRNHATE